MENSKQFVEFNYKFIFNDTSKYNFLIQLDSKSLDLVKTKKVSYPAWCKLTCNKCSICPFNEEVTEYCPIAANFLDLVDFFNKPIDEENVYAVIETPERIYKKYVDLSSIAFSLFGIYMVTSGCPIMDKLRPMVRFHMPFASTEETVYKAISMYLTAQKIRQINGLEADWSLKGLSKIYTDINTVNGFFNARLQEISEKNSAIDSIITLDCFAYYINLSLSGPNLYDIEKDFKSTIT